MKLIVGLGNPGRRYARTPHNVGFDVLDELAARGALAWRQARRIDAESAEGRIAGERCTLLKPTTYMNASGQAIAPLARGDRFEVADDILVVLDDVALTLGRLRLRASGSSGGHRGLESIINHLATRQFARLRLGVGPEGGGAVDCDLARYVLAKWPKSLAGDVETMVLRAADAAEDWLGGDIGRVMTQFNSE
jgi:peptidyl-tRNA hydrolase, PTH1 family